MFSFFKRNDEAVINVNDLDSLIGKIQLIDIREEDEYKGGSIKGAKNIPMGKILADPEKYLDKEKEYYLLCQSGARSSRLCSSLAKDWYKVINVSGGYGSYVGVNRK